MRGFRFSGRRWRESEPPESNRCRTAGHDGQDEQDEHDGQDGHDEHDGQDEHDGHDGQDGQDGQNGQDGHDEQDGQDGHDGQDGQGGHDGQDGHDGFAALVWRVTLTALSQDSLRSSFASPFDPFRVGIWGVCCLGIRWSSSRG